MERITMIWTMARAAPSGVRPALHRMFWVGWALQAILRCGGNTVSPATPPPDVSEVSRLDQHPAADIRYPEGSLDDVTPGCERNLEEVRSDRVQTTDEKVYYTRPFFTMCKDGRFFWDEWRFFYDGIMPDQVDSKAREVKCPSGECKWGICREDAEFIEDQIPSGTVMQDGLFGIENTACTPCNPNNKEFSFDWYNYLAGTYELCEGSYSCCDDPEFHDGPCYETMWYWGLFVSGGDPLNHILISQNEADYVKGNDECISTADYDCLPSEAARCRPSTATLVTSRWLSGINFTLAGENRQLQEMRLTLGTSSRIPQLREVPPALCEDGDIRTQRPFTYFTCSGMATIGLTDGRWYKFVWIHEYDPEKCTMPCWFATDGRTPVPVRIAVWEIPPEPKW